MQGDVGGSHVVSTLMPSQRVILLAILSICTSQAVALPVHVTLDWPSNTLGSHPSVRIKAVQAAGPNAGDAPVEAEAESDSVVLNLSDGIWQVQASASGYWSQGAEVVVAHQAPASVRLVFWPAASLHGAVVTAGGETLPDSIKVRLNATAASDAEPLRRPPPCGRRQAYRAPSFTAESTQGCGVVWVQPGCSTCGWRLRAMFRAMNGE